MQIASRAIRFEQRNKKTIICEMQIASRAIRSYQLNYNIIKEQIVRKNFALTDKKIKE